MQIRVIPSRGSQTQIDGYFCQTTAGILVTLHKAIQNPSNILRGSYLAPHDFPVYEKLNL
ncbi:MAG TPA: hypothetical protein DCG12_22590 [Planctomycetaceae bacterium]|nr:hypothetical protein [Planctomycetaceae bacterium]